MEAALLDLIRTANREFRDLLCDDDRRNSPSPAVMNGPKLERLSARLLQVRSFLDPPSLDWQELGANPDLAEYLENFERLELVLSALGRDLAAEKIALLEECTYWEAFISKGAGGAGG